MTSGQIANIRKNLAIPVPHRVAVLALDVVIGYDMVIPPTIFGEATDADGNALYDVRICGLDRSPVRVVTRYTIVPDHGAEILVESDTVIIPGARRSPGPTYEGTLPADLAEALAGIRSPGSSARRPASPPAAG